MEFCIIVYRGSKFTYNILIPEERHINLWTIYVVTKYNAHLYNNTHRETINLSYK